MNHKDILIKLLQPHTIQQEGIISQPKKDQQYSAVSIILRSLPSTHQNIRHRNIDIMLNTEILLLRRIDNGKMYSGEICLPGGKRDEGQTIVQTAVRETLEQTAITLTNKDLVGILNESFIAYRRASHTLITYAAVFYMQEPQQIRLNHDEISEFQWLPLRHFMREEVYKPIVIPFETFSFMTQFSDFKAIKYFQWPAIDVGMKKNLYGFTLYILAFFISRLEGSLQRFIQKLNDYQQRSLQKGEKSKVNTRILKEQFKDIQKYEKKFKQLYFNNAKIVWKEDCNISDEQKDGVTHAFEALMKQMFTERPRF